MLDGIKKRWNDRKQKKEEIAIEEKVFRDAIVDIAKAKDFDGVKVMYATRNIEAGLARDLGLTSKEDGRYVLNKVNNIGSALVEVERARKVAEGINNPLIEMYALDNLLAIGCNYGIAAASVANTTGFVSDEAYNSIVNSFEKIRSKNFLDYLEKLSGIGKEEGPKKEEEEIEELPATPENTTKTFSQIYKQCKKTGKEDKRYRDDLYQLVDSIAKDAGKGKFTAKNLWPKEKPDSDEFGDELSYELFTVKSKRDKKTGEILHLYEPKLEKDFAVTSGEYISDDNGEKNYPTGSKEDYQVDIPEKINLNGKSYDFQSGRITVKEKDGIKEKDIIAIGKYIDGKRELVPEYIADFSEVVKKMEKGYNINKAIEELAEPFK